MHHPTVGVAIITHCAKRHLAHCLPPYLNSPLQPRVLVVNSSSNDGTIEIAREMGAETLLIPRHQFNHGTTRERARHVLGTEIVVMATPDAYAKADALEKLIHPIANGSAAVAYARQLPHAGADLFEAFAREFNYPKESQLRSLKEIDEYGVYTFFCSNSCAAYRNKALDQIGGFQHVLLGEDTIAVAKLLYLGHKIAYVADAEVNHSHRYSLKQEFQRCFDIGLARNQQRTLLRSAGRDQKRGFAYTQALMSHLWERNPWMLPYAALQTVVKWMGYTLGQSSGQAPLWIKRACSTQDFYWK